MTTTAPPVTLDDIRDAAAQIKGVAHRTPVVRSRTLDAEFLDIACDTYQD